MAFPSFVEQNPWWRDASAIMQDPLVQNWMRSAFQWKPRLGEIFQWDVNVLYTLRGPRQVGKSTLIKLKIKNLIENGVNPRTIFYWTCDLVDTYEKLVTLIKEYISSIRASSKDRLYIFLDEISAVKDWQKGIKYLYDLGMFVDCLLVLTGSHSIDIRKSTESLSGRRGEVGKLRDKMPDKILVPLKFAEYAETLNENIRNALRKLYLLSLSRRLEVLSQIMHGSVPEELDELRLYSSELHTLFEDYLITGGIPRAIDCYLSKGTISRDIFSTYTDLVVRDVGKWGVKEMFLRQILRRIIETLAEPISYKALTKDTEISSHNTAAEYVEVLRDSFIVSYLYQLDKEKGLPIYRKPKKIYFQDPFFFHAIRSWVFGREPFQDTLEYLKTDELKHRLVKSVVCNHLIRLMFNLFPSTRFEYTDKAFYWRSKRKRELDFVIRFQNEYLPIELKYKRSLSRKDTYEVLDFLKTGTSINGIILSDDVYRFKKSYAILPVYLFLLLV